MANLKDITIQSSGKSAWLGGGVYDGQVLNYLWDQGYVTTTGACDCVGMMGPGLGGGHGPLEGLYGMVSDNFRQLNVVLANGTAIRVNETSYSDLLWGMKGAGHNFGIVTSFEINIFPEAQTLGAITIISGVATSSKIFSTLSMSSTAMALLPLT